MMKVRAICVSLVILVVLVAFFWCDKSIDTMKTFAVTTFILTIALGLLAYFATPKSNILAATVFAATGAIFALTILADITHVVTAIVAVAAFIGCVGISKETGLEKWELLVLVELEAFTIWGAMEVHQYWGWRSAYIGVMGIASIIGFGWWRDGCEPHLRV